MLGIWGVLYYAMFPMLYSSRPRAWAAVQSLRLLRARLILHVDRGVWNDSWLLVTFVAMASNLQTRWPPINSLLVTIFISSLSTRRFSYSTQPDGGPRVHPFHGAPQKGSEGPTNGPARCTPGSHASASARCRAKFLRP